MYVHLLALLDCPRTPKETQTLSIPFFFFLHFVPFVYPVTRIMYILYSHGYNEKKERRTDESVRDDLSCFPHTTGGVGG